ncbi:MAG TPA: VanZ family protein [Syntrophobacteraceae bacterium]|nr:VanZ family protein [Syntrophobacteraceae bacterium]
MQFPRERKVFWLWLMVLAAVCVGSMIPHGSLPEGGFPTGLAARVIAFFLLAFLPMYDFPRLRHALYAALSMALVGFFLKYLQQSIPGRHYSADDMVANNVGVLLGIVVGFVVRIRKESKQSSRKVQAGPK